MSLTIEEALKNGINILKKHDKYDADLDARYLLMHILEYDRVNLIINKNELIDKEAYNSYIELIKNRTKGVPLQYLIGEQEFMGLKFKVSEDTLIPRRETEELIELAINLIDDSKLQIIMDIGTGTGCIPISLAVFKKSIHCLGIDYSAKALEIANENSILNNVQDRVSWIFSNLFNSISEEYKNIVDMIISNPPYIKTDIIPSLMTEVRDFEPIMALDGGKDGLDFYRKICEKGKEYLKDDGFILFEIGHDQRDEVIKILKINGYKDVHYKKDLSGIDRIVYGKK